jgi:hypothetical protein
LDVREFGRRLSRALDQEDFETASGLARGLGDPPLVRSELDMKRLVGALELGLRARSTDANAAFQQAVLLALGRCGAEGGKALDRALLNMGLRNRLVVQAAIYRGLGLTGEEQRLPQLVEALRPVHPEVATAATEGLVSLIRRTDLPLTDWKRAAGELERCHRDLVTRTREPTSHPPPPREFGDPPNWPSRERVLACLPGFEAARRALLDAIQERERREAPRRNR